MDTPVDHTQEGIQQAEHHEPMADLGRARREKLKNLHRHILQQAGPCLMLICTAFTLQCIGYSMLDSWSFFRVIGGTLTTVGIFFPLVFYGEMGTKVLQISLTVSVLLTVAVSNGYLCGCR